MKKHYRILAGVLALLMLGFSLASCKKKQDDGNSGGSKEGSVTTASGDENDPYRDDLPSLDFEGRTVSLLCSGKAAVADEFFSEGESSNKVSTAVWKRNQTVKERLGIELNVILDADGASDSEAVNKKLDIAINGGDDTYDIVASHTYIAARYMLCKNYSIMKAMDYVNLEKAYWAEGFNDIFSWGNDKQYLATGSAAISIYRFLYVTIYNKEMFASFGVTDPYDLVKSGKWTIDEQYRLSKLFVSDDQSSYGLSTGYQISIDPYWVSFDCGILSKDTENHFTADTTSTDNKVSSIVDKLQQIFKDSSTVVTPYEEDGFTNLSKTIVPFYEEKAAMATCLCYAIETNMQNLVKLSYGIVPLPKYNEDQTRYYSGIQDQVTAFGVSLTVTDDRAGMVGATLECIASESYAQVVPEYYGSALSYKYLQDPQSKEMLQLTYEGSRMAMAAVYTGSLLKDTGFTTMMRKLIAAEGNTTSSTFRGIKSQLTNGVKTLNSTFGTMK